MPGPTVTVTGYTAAKMDEIAGETIIDGEVVNGDLILTKRNNQTINAGVVKGEKGDTGAQGPPGPNPIPTGTFIFGGWAAAPSGYLMVEGQTIVNGATTYAALAAVFPGWVSGNNLVMPNPDNSVLMLATGGTLGVVSGSMTHTLTVAQMPLHSHTVPSHTHTGSTNSAGSHQHSFSGTTADGGWHSHNGANGDIVQITSGGAAIDQHDGGNAMFFGLGVGAGTTNGAGTHSHTYSGTAGTSGDHSHSVSIVGSGDLNTLSAGTGAAVDHTPRNIKVKMAVKT